MSEKSNGQNSLQGLSNEEVLNLRRQYGKNIFESASDSRFLHLLKDISTEPMFILLVVACSLYFMLGDSEEGIMMAVAIVIVTAISLYQEFRSSRALQSLQQLTEPRITVLREGQHQVITKEELVPGDIVLLSEGMKIPADGRVLQSNDLSVDESPITGESLAVEKNEMEGSNLLYQGSTINSGKCVAIVTATGNRTVLGKIGKAISGYQPTKTLLQVQLNNFLKRFALFGIVAFVIVFSINYYHYGVFTTSLLFALTLAMSVIPEEIPVAFSSFMALGAYKMSRFGIISRQPQIIENLGAVTVLCLDKTGTITENRMELKSVYSHRSGNECDLHSGITAEVRDLLFFARLASEVDPFDPMEKAIHEANDLFGRDADEFSIIHEYPLEGKPPMMTHVYAQDGAFIVAAKGAAERIMRVCKLSEPENEKISQYIKKFSEMGYRVLGVSSSTFAGKEFPAIQDDFSWEFEGLVALYDPPKKGVREVLKTISEAQVKIKLITGDHPGTAMNIAGQVGLPTVDGYVSGDELIEMSEEDLQKEVEHSSIFVRVFPDAKAKIIQALKLNGEIVAMTGDGVNDGPALKLADVGIAMGKRGTQTARLSADLVLTDDKFESIATAISEGRKIFNNLGKAIRYIISIHIPIILTASVPLILGWKYPNIFTPIHVIFLELIMGPTCSIFFEREPVEQSVMLAPPRSGKAGLFSINEMRVSIIQGLMITAGVLFLYHHYMAEQRIEVTRGIVFNTLILSNIFLTFADRSFKKTIFYTSRYKNNLAPLVFLISAGFLLLLQFLPSVMKLFQVAPLSGQQFLSALLVSIVCVFWFEVYKFLRSLKQ